MSDASSASDTVKAIGFALIAAAAFFWILATVGHIGLSASDAAGNGLAQGLALVELCRPLFRPCRARARRGARRRSAAGGPGDFSSGSASSTP